MYQEDNEERKYGQLHIIDTHEACSEAPENSNCLQSIFEMISTDMENNPYAATYQNMITVQL